MEIEKQITVKLQGALAAYVSTEVEFGSYESDGEFVRDLIRRSYDREYEQFEKFRAELKTVFEVPEEDYVLVTAEDVIRRNRLRA